MYAACNYTYRSVFFFQKDTALKFGSCFSKACYITGQWDGFRLGMLYLAFFVLSHHKNSVFIVFISFFDETSNFCGRISTSQKYELVAQICQWNCMRGAKNNRDYAEKALPETKDCLSNITGNISKLQKFTGEHQQFKISLGVT